MLCYTGTFCPVLPPVTPSPHSASLSPDTIWYSARKNFTQDPACLQFLSLSRAVQNFHFQKMPSCTALLRERNCKQAESWVKFFLCCNPYSGVSAVASSPWSPSCWLCLDTGTLPPPSLPPSYNTTVQIPEEEVVGLQRWGRPDGARE